jgi:peptidoglycan-associated lipoprotein
MKRNAKITISIEGHADERGTREYNLALGQRRAESVANYLIANGINRNRLITKSYGEERPLSLGSNNSAWAKNRRVEIK